MEELLKALQTLKNFCAEMEGNCEECPFVDHIGEECWLMYTNENPCDWKLEVKTYSKIVF